MSAILNAEPPELSGSGRKVPPGLDRITRHCLEKNAEERFQSARDLAFALESASQTSGEQPAAAAPRRKLPAAALLGAVALLLGAGLYWMGSRSHPEDKPVTFRRITFRRGDVAEARFTPDGESVVYSAAFDGGPTEVYLTRWDGHDARPLGMPDMRVGRRLAHGRARGHEGTGGGSAPYPESRSPGAARRGTSSPVSRTQLGAPTASSPWFERARMNISSNTRSAASSSGFPGRSSILRASPRKATGSRFISVS